MRKVKPKKDRKRKGRRQFIRNVASLGVFTVVSPALVKAAGRLQQADKKETDRWSVQQFKDAGLAHFSYALLVDKKIYLVDPARDATPYFDYARANGASIAGIIETHPHADFVSSHLEIHRRTGAPIYVSRQLAPAYMFTPFNQDDRLELAPGIFLRGLDTPGHAPDGISVVLEEDGKDKLVFSGDSLLIGDVGRPDLREYNGDVSARRELLARQMFITLKLRFAPLADDVILYPAHGAGSLCGKSMRDAASSTIGEEKRSNPAFQIADETAFVKHLLQDLPAVPEYFPFDVALNVKGAPDLKGSLKNIPLASEGFRPPLNAIIIDARPETTFRFSHLSDAYNLQDGSKFETWLGSIIAPGQRFFLVAGDKAKLASLAGKIAKIGYEAQIAASLVYTATDGRRSPEIDNAEVLAHPEKFTIIDVRSAREAANSQLFPSALLIPVNELAKRQSEIPQGKPIVVHCASGYRSALGSSMLQRFYPSAEIYDFGTAVTNYLKHP
ncbi:MBL fold metallo-hydrolase [Flavihumibacter petaseus]|uniref:Putative hydrolase n=1 Tax=Flavihumibacter petaseus NBRC 106054 TaxID=1220578 RepID=A0A0E9MYC0_9BACT|nr:MBL fold metallo-hydrolase [Flavihumibacter petaseus]GAO42498.1 putative hydrolase [Flavihumibacter petaseus NBRC 106054]